VAVNAITCGRGVVGGVLGQSARRQGRPDGRWPVTCLQLLHLEQGTGCSLERKADCAGDQDINGRRPLGSYRQRSVGGGVAEGKDSHCQCQAADDDSGGDRADCRQPDAGEGGWSVAQVGRRSVFPLVHLFVARRWLPQGSRARKQAPGCRAAAGGACGSPRWCVNGRCCETAPDGTQRRRRCRTS